MLIATNMPYLTICISAIGTGAPAFARKAPLSLLELGRRQCVHAQYLIFEIN